MSDGHTERLESALDGKYKIERKLGEGGMASVYLAADIKHERKVAVKVLRPELAAVIGAERFLAEIKTTANLQHPHILPLFDSGEADGYLYYVMPFIDGETLAERLRRERQLGVDEAVRIAREVADALEHAHRAGVIHRDIKPGNILLQNGRPIVADFGIALAVSEAGGGRMTETGLSLGTPHYMSPEQASADRELSVRSDVYSLGCVLYEMIAGQPPHTGPSAQSILVRILTETPAPLTELRHTVPAQVAAAVAKAIEKLPADRFDTAGDFSAALANEAFRYEGAGRTTQAAAASAPAAAPGWLSHAASKAAVGAIAGLGIALAVVGSGALGERQAEAFPPAVVRFELDSADLADVEAMAVSRDGSGVAFAKTGGAGVVYMKLDGSERREWKDFVNPVFSHDGRWVLLQGSAGNSGLYRASVDGGAPLEIDLGEALALPADWTSDGTIYYSTLDGLYRLPEGGEPERLLDEGLVTTRWFRVLPGGRAGIFTYGAIDADLAEVRLLDLETREVRTLIEDGFDAQYLPSGHLVYARFDRALVTVPFDLETRSIGQAVSVMDSLRIGRQWAQAFFRVSETGTAVYLRGGRDQDEERASRILTHIDLDGRLTPEPLPPAGLSEVAVSPDGRRVAYIAENKLHVYDLITGTDQVLGDHVAVGFPAWSPEGSEISVVHLGGGRGLFATSVGPADGSGPFTTLDTDFAMVAVTHFTPDGTRLLAMVGMDVEDGNLDLYVLGRDGGDAVPYLRADWNEVSGVVSPDGGWVAYVSDQSDSDRVYVRSFPDPGPPTGISDGQANEPRWSPDGGTLYYESNDSVYAAALSFDDAEVAVGPRRALFARDTERGRLTDWDVHPDGGFIGVIQPDASDEEQGDDDEAVDAAPARGYVVVNWVEEMRRRVGGGGN